MKINKKTLEKDIRELEHILARNYGKNDYVFDYITATYYDEILYEIGGNPTHVSERIFSREVADKINEKMDKALHGICEFYNTNSDMMYKGMVNFEKIITSDDIMEQVPTHQLRNIPFSTFKDLILSYYATYGNKVYNIVKKYFDEERIYLGSSMDADACGVFFGSLATQKGYITVEKKKKLSLYTAGSLVHELGHGVDFETFIFPQRKKISSFDDLLIELPSYHFETGFYDYLIKNNIYLDDAHALVTNLYREFMTFATIFGTVKGLDNFYIEEGGFITNEAGNFLDMNGDEILPNVEKSDEDCCVRRLDATEMIKYSLGMFLAFQTNALASENREAYLKNLFNCTMSRREVSLEESLDMLGISKEQFESCSLIEDRIKDELVYTRKRWKL